ncbi:MAG: 16S rRNA (adenine(1518)-N(6)/adenine(1519)-N(6))-dimethyltransferase RsmA [Patescibacteria group bacterium]|jgi:16S rRNA (adenine1518-N6/adenine1519-N6)-dimethyltransferase|nr:16S rRNA (adenine(1518)-N(6)/adenine(1519)-N(6))-dimethyltransferase RsmA [Patescibacteria group bacterium]
MSELHKKTREICKIMEIKPTRSKGQNFLINEKIYDDVVKAADINSEDIVLEVGPGLGFLTVKLANKAKKVVAVELDDTLANYLKVGVSAQDDINIDIVNEDILNFDIEKYFKEQGYESVPDYKIVANLPYNISSIFLRTILTAKIKPSSLTLMLQKEVAQRIVSGPPDNNLLALSVAYYGEAKIIREVKAGNFWPEPEVDSAVIKINVDKNKEFNLEEDKLFFRLAKVTFSSKRKMIKNNIAAGLKLEVSFVEKLLNDINIDPHLRAERLSLSDYKIMFATLKSFMV